MTTQTVPDRDPQFDIHDRAGYIQLELMTMRNLAEILEIIATHKASLERRYKIRRIAVFGSYVRQDQGPDSDVDVLVEFEHPPGLAFVDLADELETILRTRVDLVSRGALSQRGFESIASDLRYV